MEDLLVFVGSSCCMLLMLFLTLLAWAIMFAPRNREQRVMRRATCLRKKFRGAP